VNANPELMEEVRVRLLRIKNQLEYTYAGLAHKIVRADGTPYSERIISGWMRKEDMKFDHQEMLAAVSRVWPHEFRDLACPYSGRCCPFGPPREPNPPR